MEKSKKKGVLLRVLSISAIAAITAGVIGAGTMARYSSQFGADGLEGDGGSGARGARAAQFHFVGQYAKDGGEFSDATGNLSLFSSMYLSSTGRGTTTATDDVTVNSASGQVVAPGTNGALSLKMDTTDAVTVDKRCYAETDTIVKLDVKQLQTGVYSDASAGSKIPIVYTINGKYYVQEGSNLVKDHTYIFNNNVSGTMTQTTVTIDGYLDDMAENNAYYYKAKDKFYQLDGTAPTYTAADKAHIVDTDGNTDGIQNAGTATLTFAMDWIWNYQNLGDITDYVDDYKDDHAGATTAAAIAAFNNEDAATKARYLTQASAAANDAWDTALGEAAFAKANGGTDTTGDIQLSVRVDATQVD